MGIHNHQSKLPAIREDKLERRGSVENEDNEGEEGKDEHEDDEAAGDEEDEMAQYLITPAADDDNEGTTFTGTASKEEEVYTVYFSSFSLGLPTRSNHPSEESDDSHSTDSNASTSLGHRLSRGFSFMNYLLSTPRASSSSSSSQRKYSISSNDSRNSIGAYF